MLEKKLIFHLSEGALKELCRQKSTHVVYSPQDLLDEIISERAERDAGSGYQDGNTRRCRRRFERDRVHF